MKLPMYNDFTGWIAGVWIVWIVFVLFSQL